MMCATGAVACLASFNVQWSSELPVQRSRWEQDLFADLTTPAVPHLPEVSPDPSTEPLPSPAERLWGGPVLVEVLPAPMENTHAASSAHQPAGSLARFIQPAQHQQSGDSPTVWLSGGIELLSDDPKPTSQPGTRYFPDVPLE